MNSPQTDYYRVLGLPTTATADTIKRRYRELARRYHPDVNPSAEAAQKIKVINEAYHHLGDPDRRALYDAERLLRTPRPDTARSSRSSSDTAHSESQTSRPVNTPPGRYGASGMHAGFDGFGRVPVDPPGSGENAAPAGTRPSAGYRQRTEPQSPLDRLVTDAQLAFIMHRYNEAERLCRQILAMDRRQAVAHEILGDIYRHRGDRERAVTSYSYAVQFNPRNQSAQIKLERLSGVPYSERSRGPTVTHRPAQPLVQQWLSGPNREAFLALTSLSVLTALAGVLLFFYFFQGSPWDPGNPLLGEFSLNLVVSLLASGMLIGILLALYGGMRPMTQELVLRTRTKQRFPLTMLLTACAVVSIYFSFLAYILISAVQNRLSVSVLRAYGATFLLTVLFYCLYRLGVTQDFSTQTLEFAGNILFPSILVGWKIGDWLRLGGA